MKSIAIYVHLPWCVRKCPYCDFNSHQADPSGALPEAEYVARLIEDLKQEQQLRGKLEAHSVFFGGGTPSLFSAKSIGDILSAIDAYFPLQRDAEITLESNPGTFEYERYKGYREVGVNRLSVGVQSFCDNKLSALGRIHSAQNAIDAIAAAKEVGFDNFNIDIMHGLPDQSIEEALDDLRQAIALEPTHLSWYQLTIETNTQFYSAPPTLPDIDTLDEIEIQGFDLLRSAGFAQYEVSAWARKGLQSRHNLSYWDFEDYVGIGAGAHGKHTNARLAQRRQKTRQPEHYLDQAKDLCAKSWDIPSDTIVFEYLLNRLRLFKPVPIKDFERATQCSFASVIDKFTHLEKLGLVELGDEYFALSPRGQRFLNNVLNEFLPE